MTEPLVKQIVDLKEEHELMLQALKLVNAWWISPLHSGVQITDVEKAMAVAIEAAEAGNERRLERGNVDLPDRRGMKDGSA